jgi:sugar O-acyltransferase (sialic acid O-acetyltransferase NeuD family)
MKKVLMLGGLGNASVIADAILDANRRGYKECECVGYINDRDNVKEIEGRPVLGGLKDVPKFIEQGYYFINTIYKIDGQRERIDLFNSLNIPEDRLITFVHPTAYVAPNVELSPGCIIMPNVSITSSTKLSKCCIVRPGATIGHNNRIGAHSSIIAGARVGSFITIGEGVYIGLGAIVKEFVKIGNYSTVGIGSVVVKDIGESEVWFGNPAKFLRYSK